MSELPLISVLIPVYNAEKFLTACLDSVVNQTYRNIEVIAVNDGSTDGSLAILRDYALRDTRFKIIDKPNEGSTLARKQAIVEAQGDYIYFLDSDDYIDRAAIEKLYHEIIRTNCSIAASEIVMVRPSYNSHVNIASGGCCEGLDFARNLLTAKTPFSVAGRLYERQLLENLSFHREITQGDDLFVNLQISLKPEFRGICFVADAIYYYIQHSGSLTHQRYDFDYEKMFIDRVDELMKSYPEITVELQDELLAFHVIGIYNYIKHSSSKWMGDQPLIRKTIDEIRKNPGEIRRITPQGAIRMLKLYRYRCLKPIINIASTVTRWRNSIRKRVMSRKSKQRDLNK